MLASKALALPAREALKAGEAAMRLEVWAARALPASHKPWLMLRCATTTDGGVPDAQRDSVIGHFGLSAQKGGEERKQQGKVIRNPL
jgi:hypothetical protein